MAETLYSPSSSGYTSDNYYYLGGVWEYLGKNGWSTSTSTAIQGTPAPIDDFTNNANYYGVIYFDFNAIRSKNVTHYPVRIRVRLLSHTGSTRTANVHIGKGMAKDSYTSGTRPTDATGASVKTVSCAANSWCEINTTDQAWLDAIVDGSTTCIFVMHSASGVGTPSTGRYIEFDGAKTTNKPELYIDWALRNQAPGAPNGVSISTTGRIVNGYGNVGGRTTLDVSCGLATDDLDAGTSLQYQWEYSVSSGAWNVFQGWTTNGTSATLDITGMPEGAGIQFRAQAKDTGGLTGGYTYSANVGYRVMVPWNPGGVYTPSNLVTTNKNASVSLSWIGSGNYDGSAGLLYEVQFYDPRYGWRNIDSSVNGTSSSCVPYSLCGLPGNLMHYYFTNCKIRVRSRTSAVIQGDYIWNSSYVESGNFTVDYRSSPSVAFGAYATTNLYEGTQHTLSITKTAQGNDYDSNGNATVYYYVIDLLYGASVYTMYQNSWTSWAGLPTSVQVTIPSVASSADISNCSIRLTVYNNNWLYGQSSLSSKTVKRYRNPIATITNINRQETQFIVTYSITDTGLGTQNTSDIWCNASGTRLTFSTNTNVPTLTALTNQTSTFSAAATASGTCTLYVFNNPGDSMTKKSAIVSQNIPTYLPNFRISGTAIYAKGALYVWDANGVAQAVWHAGNFSPSGTLTHNVAAGADENILYGTIGDNDFYRIRAGGASNAGYLEIATADDGTEPIYVRQYTGTFTSLTRTFTLLDGSGNTAIPGSLTIGGQTAWHAGNFNPTNYTLRTSAGRPGVYKLYRNEADDPYNVQTTWTGSYWLLRGYYNDTYHAGCQVAYADYAWSAGSAPANGGNADTVDGAHIIYSASDPGYVAGAIWLKPI